MIVEKVRIIVLAQANKQNKDTRSTTKETVQLYNKQLL